jgi:hypothetical protein
MMDRPREESMLAGRWTFPVCRIDVEFITITKVTQLENGAFASTKLSARLRQRLNQRTSESMTSRQAAKRTIERRLQNNDDDRIQS